MLRLSKKADYALMAVKHLAVKPSPSASAREIAEQYDIPVELMAKVLQRLVRSGLLMSTQGTRGGYTLGRPAAAMSVADVIQAIDGPLAITACTADKHDCDQYRKCSIRDPLWQIRERIAATLERVTIAELATDIDDVGRVLSDPPASRVPKDPAYTVHAAVLRR